MENKLFYESFLGFVANVFATKSILRINKDVLFDVMSNVKIKNTAGNPYFYFYILLRTRI